MNKLLTNLNYSFKDITLLDRALCHRSFSSDSNERMEFLGDAVLSLVISSELFDKYPDLQEGELSQIRSNLVNRVTLARLAKRLDVGKYLKLGLGEVKSGGRDRDSILSNAMEAIIGAVYLDSGIERCCEFILFLYSSELNELDIHALKDFKTRLQELVQAKKLSLPLYKVIFTSGKDHEQVFHVECRVPGLSEIAVGVGSTKRKAEQNAARDLLSEIGLID